MRGQRKRIEAVHLEFLRDYIGKKILHPDSFAELLINPGDVAEESKGFNEVMDSRNLERINQWFLEKITPEAWRRMWLAKAGRRNRENNPRSEHTIHKELATKVKSLAGTNDINEAVAKLVEMVTGK